MSRVLAGVALLALATAAVADGSPTPTPALKHLLGEELADGGVIFGETSRRLIHFTFDDGPAPDTTPRLLDKLDRAGVKATFFFSASRFADGSKRNERAVELARETARRGHSIGSHSVRHPRMGKLSPAELKQQLQRSDELFRQVFGARTFLFRPPFGSRNRTLDRLLKEQHYTTVIWNVGLADWVERPAADVLGTWRKVLQRNERRDGQRGGIVLLHDTHAWTVAAFDLIMADIAQRNCGLLAQGQELIDVVPDLAPFMAADGARSAAQVRRLEQRQQALRERASARCGHPSAAAPPG